MNPNTPVIIGVSQVLQRVKDLNDAKEPVDLMVEAALKAADDCKQSNLLKHIESVRVVRGWWRYEQPAGYVAKKLGCGNAELVGTCYGGNMVQCALNTTALDIINGEKTLVLLTGAETGNSAAKAKKSGKQLPIKDTHGEYDRVIGQEESMSGEAELARGIRQPIQMYPIFENALRYHERESINAHQTKVAKMWAGFSKVATRNPNAWITEAFDADAIRTPSEKNRMVSFPYPKLMNSNNSVDMASAIIICSVARAKELGIDESKWVFPWVGTDAHDTYTVSERDNLYSSPAIRIAGKRALELAGLSVSDLDFVDVYSCFPVAVQVAAKELGLSLDRELTVTGGLTFGGGPLNNYVMHSIARTVELLRENPGKKGFVTANGGFLTKHSFGIYSADAPEIDYQHEDVQAEVDACPTRDWLGDYLGDVTIESYTVMFSGDVPSVGHFACLTPNGQRTWANSSDPEILRDMQVVEYCGKLASLDGAGNLTLR